MFYINGYIVGVFGNVLLLPNIWNKLASISSGWCMYMFTLASILKTWSYMWYMCLHGKKWLSFSHSIHEIMTTACWLLCYVHIVNLPLKIEFSVSILKTSCLWGLRTMWPFIVASRARGSINPGSHRHLFNTLVWPHLYFAQMGPHISKHPTIDRKSVV